MYQVLNSILKNLRASMSYIHEPPCRFFRRNIQIPPAMRHVMLIEDDALVRTLIAHHAMDADWRVTTLKDGRELERMLQDEPADLLLIDLGLPHVDGLSLLEDLRARGVKTPVLIITAYELPHLMTTVMGAGANGLLQKPFDPDELIDRMERMLAA